MVQSCECCTFMVQSRECCMFIVQSSESGVFTVQRSDPCMSMVQSSESGVFLVQSAAQQAKEDAAIAGQVRGEMWGNLQGILAMLAGQGCSPHVQDMVHQIAVHFANEQSQSVALERRLTGNIAKEKEAQKRTQQQLQGGIQVGFLAGVVCLTCEPDAQHICLVASQPPKAVPLKPALASCGMPWACVVSPPALTYFTCTA